MASIYVRGNKLWIRYYYNKKVHRESLEIYNNKVNREKAEQVRLQKELELKRKVQRRTSSFFSDAVFDFLQEKKLNTVRWEMYEFILKDLSDILQRDLLVSSIVPDDIIKYKQRLERKKKSPETVKSYINHLKAFFNWCIKEKYLDANPVNIKIKVTKKPPRIIQDEHLHKILWYLKVHNTNQYTLIKFLVLTGFRIGEALNLQWRHIDHNNGIIKVHNTKENRIDIFPIHKKLKVLLKEIDRAKPQPFIYSQDGLKFWNKTLKRLELPHYSLHDLRRKFGTTQAENGMSHYKLQKLMRHKSILTTMTYYVNVDIRKIGDEIK